MKMRISRKKYNIVKRDEGPESGLYLGMSRLTCLKERIFEERRGIK